MSNVQQIIMCTCAYIYASQRTILFCSRKPVRAKEIQSMRSRFGSSSNCRFGLDEDTAASPLKLSVPTVHLDTPVGVAVATAVCIVLTLFHFKPQFVLRRNRDNKLMYNNGKTAFSLCRVFLWVTLPSALVLWKDEMTCIYSLLMRPLQST